MRYPALDIVRGIAAFWVVFFHLIPLSKINPDIPGWFLVEGLTRQGWIGVDIFLVLSGMVITLAIGKLRSATWPGQCREFFRHRLARLLPLHYLTCVIFVLLVADAPAPAIDLLRHALLVHNLFPDSWGSINAPNWSIGLEFQWYLLAFLAFPFLQRASTGVIVSTGLAVSLVWQAVTLYRLHLSGELSQLNVVIFSSQLPGMTLHFFLGSLIPRFRPLRRKALPLAILAAAFVAYVAMLAWADYEYRRSQQEWLLWAFTFSRVGLAAVIAGVLFCIYDARIDSRWCAAPLYVGMVSYGVYLWQQIVMDILKAHLSGGALIAAAVTCILLLASASWFLFERPILRMAR